MLKQLNPEQIEVEILLAPLDEKPHGIESELSGDVELCGEEIESSVAMVREVTIVVVEF